MRLVPVRGNPDAAPLLYELLSERPRYAWISHDVLPSRSQHEAFVASHPFMYWFLIEIPTIDPEIHCIGGYAYAGALEATDRNEIGIAILRRYQRVGYGAQALRLFMNTHSPLPAIKAVRNGRWLANIAVANDGAKDFFHQLGFAPVQETWQL